MNVTIEDTRM